MNSSSRLSPEERVGDVLDGLLRRDLEHAEPELGDADVAGKVDLRNLQALGHTGSLPDVLERLAPG
jgi:hypothetical protein